MDGHRAIHCAQNPAYRPTRRHQRPERVIHSPKFRVRWAGHNVRLHDHGNKRFHHPVVGDLTLSFEELPVPADPGLTITAYTAESGTASHDALALLASWAATPDNRPT